MSDFGVMIGSNLERLQNHLNTFIVFVLSLANYEKEVVQVVVNTLANFLLNVKGLVVERIQFFHNTPKRLQVFAHPVKAQRNRCPFCGRQCPGYDTAYKEQRHWRHLDFGGILVYITAQTHRIECPEHGVVTAAVPWADHNCAFTRDFDNTVAWLARENSRSTITKFMGIDWKTVGRCISRALNRIEPDRSVRFDGLVNIGIDETSYRKGHKYILTVTNHDTRTVIWVGKGFGETVLTQFFEALTPEQRESIKVVTGDGAQWITRCVEKFCPNATRCIDSFHVAEWVTDTLNNLRLRLLKEAEQEVQKLEKKSAEKRGRSSKKKREGDEALSEARQKAASLKGLKYPLGKAPEHLTEAQRIRLDTDVSCDKRIFRGYNRKEELRRILHMADGDAAAIALKGWLWWASHSRIPEFIELGHKIKRNQELILNTIRTKLSNARIEGINNKIKLLVRRAYGFRNVQNLIDFVLLICSNLVIPLPNRAPEEPLDLNLKKRKAA